MTNRDVLSEFDEMILDEKDEHQITFSPLERPEDVDRHLLKRYLYREEHEMVRLLVNVYPIIRTRNTFANGVCRVRCLLGPEDDSRHSAVKACLLEVTRER